MGGQPEPGSNPYVGVDCTALNVLDPDGTPSPLIIKDTDRLRLAADFTFSGSWADWVTSLALAYTVTYFYEGFGAAPEGEFGQVPGTTVGGQRNYGDAETGYEATPQSKGMTPGTYMLSTVVTFTGAPITAFSDKHVVIQVYS